MDAYEATGIAEGFIDGDEEQTILAWQHLVDTGLCWRLQGRFGRIARDLLVDGIIEATTPEAKIILGTYR